MKKRLLLFFWVNFLAWACSRFYYANLDTLPRFPKMFWVSVNRIFEAHDADSWADVEFFTVYGVFFFAIAIFHAIAFFAWRKMKRRKTNSH
jgi:hypothetical protein